MSPPYETLRAVMHWFVCSTPTKAHLTVMHSIFSYSGYNVCTVACFVACDFTGSKTDPQWGSMSWEENQSRSWSSPMTPREVWNTLSSTSYTSEAVLGMRLVIELTSFQAVLGMRLVVEFGLIPGYSGNETSERVDLIPGCFRRTM